MAANLSQGVLNVEALKEHAMKEILQILDTYEGNKALVIDPALSGPLSLVSSVKLMQQHGVTEFVLLDTPTLMTQNTNVVYISRPVPELMQLIASQIKSRMASRPGVSCNYGVYLTPRRSLLCEKVLSDQGVTKFLTMGEMQLDLIPFDHDTLSLEMPHTFRECFVEGDPTSLYYVARSLIRLQAIFGVIPLVKGKGNGAHRVFQLMHRLRTELGDKFFGHTTPEIEQLILIDRTADMVSPCLTQFTYEGLIDELFRIKNGIIEVERDASDAQRDKDAGKPPAPPGAKKKLPLNSSDTLFNEVRDLSFRGLGTLLHKKAEYIKETYAERHAAQSVQDMHAFLAKFKSAHLEHTLLQTHISLAEKVSAVVRSRRFDRRLDAERAMVECTDQTASEDFLEEMIGRRDPLPAVLRILTLISVTVGINRRKHDFFRREIIQTYGLETQSVLLDLERIAVLSRAQRKGDWAKLRRLLRLVEPEAGQDGNSSNANAGSWPVPVSADYYYQYSGVAPLSVRLVEIAGQPGGLRRHDEAISQLPGKAFEYRQTLPEGVAARMAPVAGYDMAAPASACVETTTAAATAAAAAASAGGFSQSNTSAAVAAAAAAAAAVSGASGGAGSLSNVTWRAPLAAGADDPSLNKKPVTLVFFIGGVTFAEISALRHLSEREGHNREYVIATTKLINGTTLMETAFPPSVSKIEDGRV